MSDSLSVVKSVLQRLHAQLLVINPDFVAWVELLLSFVPNEEQQLYRQLNSREMWGGAGSIANLAMADNPGMNDWEWRVRIRGFREIMIELGEHLQSHGQSNPDISSWLLAFNNWNQTEI